MEAPLTSLAAKKFALIEYIMQLDEEGLSRLENTVSSFQEMDGAIEKYNKELEEANASIERGEGIPHEEVVRQLNEL
ncbi:MAG: hypothetical protein AAFQ98_10855 [Bacteroidota bacterium]